MPNQGVIHCMKRVLDLAKPKLVSRNHTADGFDIETKNGAHRNTNVPLIILL